MCVAIYNKQGVLIPKDTFEMCARTNSDGMGFVIPVDGKLFIHKNMKNIEEFYDTYRSYREKHPDKKMVIHFRMSTQGSVSLENAHPFIIHDGLAFVHNGIVSGMGYDGSKSDTRIYNERILQKLPKDFHKNKTILKLLIEYGGSFNKFIFIDKDGYVLIIGDNKGHYDTEGNWFSNTNWKHNYNSYSGMGYGAYGAYGADINYGGYQKTTYNEDKWERHEDGTYKYKEKKKVYEECQGWLLVDGTWKLKEQVERDEKKKNDKRGKNNWYDRTLRD